MNQTSSYLNLLGAHVSTSGGVHNAPLNGAAIGCNAIQIFAKNQRQWAAKPLTEDEVVQYHKNLAATKIKFTVSHDSYLINMASPDRAMVQKSKIAFADEIRRAVALKLDGIVFHPGSHMGAGEEKGIATIVQSLNEVVDSMATVPLLLIETTAGQGTNLGWRFEHIRDILSGIKAQSCFGVCVDTCHIFGAGYSLVEKELYDESFRRFNEIIGIAKIHCFHVNDSKQPLSSRKDRHDNIGNGLIGKKAFSRLMNDSRFINIPKILETPGGDEWYRKDLAFLRSLITI